MTKHHTGRFRTLVAVLLALALVAAACGGDDDAEPEASGDDGVSTEQEAEPEPEPEPEPDAEPEDAEDAEEPETEPSPESVTAPEAESGSADAAAEPVRIGLLNQENDPVGSFPEFRQGAEGAVAYINAELGGIGGRPIELVPCIQNSVETAQECAQELATADLVSIVNAVNIWTFAFDFYGTMGETPVIGGLPLFPSDYDQANARYFNGGSISVYAAMARFAAEELGVSDVAVLLNQNPAATAALEQGLEPVFEQFGVTFTAIDVPLPLTDAIPPVSQAAAQGADLVMLLAAANECVPVIRARDQLGIPAEQMMYSATCADEDVYAEVGELLVGSWMARGGYVQEDPWAPQEVKDLLDQFEVDIETYAPDAPDAAFTGLGWVTLLDIHDLYEEVGVDNLTIEGILGVMDDGQTRGRVGSYGWSCRYADIGLQSVCQGENLFVQIVDSDGNSAPPPNDGAYVNGLELLGG